MELLVTESCCLACRPRARWWAVVPAQQSPSSEGLPQRLQQQRRGEQPHQQPVQHRGHVQEPRRRRDGVCLREPQGGRSRRAGGQPQHAGLGESHADRGQHPLRRRPVHLHSAAQHHAGQVTHSSCPLVWFTRRRLWGFRSSGSMFPFFAECSAPEGSTISRGPTRRASTKWPKASAPQSSERSWSVLLRCHTMHH